MNEVFPIELTISQRIVHINSVEELRDVLNKVMRKQVFLKFGIIQMIGFKPIGAVFFDKKQINFKLTKALCDIHGVYTETPKQLAFRNNAKKQIDNYLQFIIDVTIAQRSTGIILTNNSFSVRETDRIEDSESFFTQDEIAKIFQKISTPHIRFLCKDFISNFKELHKIALIYYHKYGGYLLTFLLSLPTVKFADKQCYEIRDYHKGNYLIPTLIIKTQATGKEITICFYPPIVRTNAYSSVATLISSSNQVLGEITMKGIIVPKIETFKSILSLFAKAISGGVSIFSGVEFGAKCLYCKLPLEDPASIKRGYGKTCADKFNLPY